MKIQINDIVREATEQEIAGIEQAILEANNVIEIEKNKQLEIEAAYSKLLQLGLSPNEASAVTGFKPQINDANKL